MNAQDWVMVAIFGYSLRRISLLFVYPFAFEGKLVQYIGRIQRSGKSPVIFDYRDSRIDYFDEMFKQRNRYYNKLRKVDTSLNDNLLNFSK